jgi:hypothetical protein
MMAPWRVSTAKGVGAEDGMEGMTPDLVVLRTTGGGGGASWTWDTWAAAKGTRPRIMDLYILKEVGGFEGLCLVRTKGC